MLSIPRLFYFVKYPRYLSIHTLPKNTVHVFKNAHEQMDCIKLAYEEPNTDWAKLKSIVLKKPGTINQKNFEGILLKNMVNSEKFDAALSYADFLRKSSEELSLGSTNGLLGLYFELGKKKKLSDKDKEFILETYDRLYEKYKILDFSTCEKLLHALCVIDEWQKSVKVLEDIKVSTTPSHSAYSTLIATLFRNNKNAEAIAMIQTSINDRRAIQDIAYDEWIQYINRKYKQKKTKLKYLDEICVHIAKNFVTVKQVTAEKMKDAYDSLGWRAQLSNLDKSGQCQCCNQILDCLSLSDEEFKLLQTNVKEKLIVGSDLFLKTSPEELKRFTNFLRRTAPYDIVLDALNIAFATRQQHNVNRVNLLTKIVNTLLARNKKIMLLGRKHMLRWPRQQMQYLMSNTDSFFTDDLSQDDPYFITAAITSGPTTDIVSKDLLRGHLFKMKDEKLRILFRRWQWQHQWTVLPSKKDGVLILQEPLKFTPTAQKNISGWHLPYVRQENETTGHAYDVTPMTDLTSWLCIQSNRDS